MDYKKKYEDALEKARQLCAYPTSKPFISDLQDLFPELKESEDEKTKRILHSILSKISFHLRDIFTEEEFQCFDAWSNAWLKKQGEKPHGKSALEAIKEEKVDNDICKKPTNKVEPKFNVGDWVVRKDGCCFFNDRKAALITKIDEEQYWFDSGTWLEAEDIRHWTIEDAKEGDILASKNTSCVLIFKGISGSTCFSSHYNTGEQEDDDDWNKKNFLPATGKQRGFLFSKMKEEGYKWDAKNKAIIKL